MAHPKRRVSGKKSYRFKGSWGPHTIELARRFLAAVEAEAPNAVEEWRSLFPLAKAAIETQTGYYYAGDTLKFRTAKTGPEAEAARAAYENAIREWAARHYLAAPWLIQAAHGRFEAVVNVGGPVTWPRAFSTDMFYTPVIAELTFTVPASKPGDRIADYRKRATEAFRAALDQRIAEAVASFEADPAIVREKFMEEGSWGAVADAAHWQAGPEPRGLSRSDWRTVADVLKQLGLTPRPGLSK